MSNEGETNEICQGAKIYASRRKRKKRGGTMKDNNFGESTLGLHKKARARGSVRARIGLELIWLELK
jgi:hypothetical protein